MALMEPLSDALKRLLSKDQVDSVDRLIRESDLATARKLEEERKAKGPAVAALAAAQVASDVEKEQKRQELFLKLRRRQPRPLKEEQNTIGKRLQKLPLERQPQRSMQPPRRQKLSE